MPIGKLLSRISAVLAMILFLPVMCFSSTSEITSISQLNNPLYRVGTDSAGSLHDNVIGTLTDAKIQTFNSFMDGCISLQNGKIDALTCNEPEFIAAMKNGLDNVKILHGVIGEPIPIAAGISDRSEIYGLKEKFNTFIAGLKADGTLSDMYKRWVYDDNKKMPEIDVPEKSDIHLTIGTTGSVMPFSFYVNSTVTGFDIELARRFAAYLGAEIEFRIYDFSSILMALKNGSIDIALSNLYATAERGESVNFSDTIFTVNCIAVVLDDGKSSENIKTETGDFSDFNGKRIGVFTGSVQHDIVTKAIPDVKISYFDSIANITTALKVGKIDAAAIDETIASEIESINPDLTHINKSIGQAENAFLFPKFIKNNPILDDFNEYLRRIKSDGTLDEIQAIWAGDDDSKKIIPDYSDFPDTKGIIKIAADNETPLFSYMKDGRLVGYDVDIMTRFCLDKGYRPEFNIINFTGLISAVHSGKCDVGIGGITITKERSESVVFSEPMYSIASVLLTVKPKDTPKPAENYKNKIPKYKTFAEFDGKTIGMQPGIPDWENWVAENLPNSQVQYYNTYPDLASALKTHKIEGFLLDSPVLSLMAAEDNELTAIPQPVGQIFGYSFAYAMTEKGRKLCDEMNEYIRKIKTSGELDAIHSKWQGADEAAKIPPDFKNLPAENGTIIFATEGCYPPFNYYKDNKLAGIDIEIAMEFCKAYGYRLDVQTMLFDAMIPAVNSGKVDFAGDFTPSDEHEEAVYCSDSYCDVYSVIACLKTEDSTVQSFINTSNSITNIDSHADDIYKNDITANDNESSFLKEIALSFKRTFIREDRWKLFAEGILNTMIITVSSILCGIILGFVAFMLCRTGSNAANIITKFSVWLIKGTPIVVLLMILYYIIFGSVNINGIIVSIIAFTLIFGTSVYRMLTFGTGAVDRGQTEAAYALGFTNMQTFFTVILPQAALHFMPSFREEVTMLIKSTSVVGYIAVQDLTKMGDIVRSRTYEAFFPLIAVAVIYFVLAGMLNIIVTAIELHITPSKRKPEDILQGINMNERN